MENCLECCYTYEVESNSSYTGIGKRIRKFLGSFVLEGAEEMSKFK